MRVGGGRSLLFEHQTTQASEELLRKEGGPRCHRAAQRMLTSWLTIVLFLWLIGGGDGHLIGMGGLR